MAPSYITYNETNAPPPAYTPHSDGGAPKQDPLASIDSLLDGFRTLHREQNLPQNSKLYVTRQPEPINPMAAQACASPSGKRTKWSRSLFHIWGDLRNCVSACFCPCVAFGQNADRVDHLQRTSNPHPDPFGLCCSDSCCMYVACIPFCGVACGIQAQNRRAVRERYGIEGNIVTDCFASTCCYPCQLTQESRQIALEERQWTEMSHV
ncbi:PLAC8 family-domain-containing protein [Desarmillaria tabescens]|uniref:PLAC8 family-domain-containing protein n=1 Tax=Armillaria tabescens TaxID=1929756 RepID=A0AA39MY56_ARMTA|nr:PLAC8 family-domain-containing protein [Desarmillaria tabescens]KAK0450379.1 PLAC8 family-domain-containing protein [Desarmillaria tabescens]